MWHLIEHFFDTPLIVKAMVGVGWLAIVIMVLSFISPLFN